MSYKARERVRKLRERRKLEGLRRVEYWVDELEKIDMDAMHKLLTETRRNSPVSDSKTGDGTE
jgi:hypothetical protein